MDHSSTASSPEACCSPTCASCRAHHARIAYSTGHVRRWHTDFDLVGQTIADHQGRVATLLLLLHPAPSVDLLRAALLHDAAEAVVGDVPYHIKKSNPALAAALREAEGAWLRENGLDHSQDAEVLAWLKFADRLEAVLWACMHGLGRAARWIDGAREAIDLCPEGLLKPEIASLIDYTRRDHDLRTGSGANPIRPSGGSLPGDPASSL